MFDEDTWYGMLLGHVEHIYPPTWNNEKNTVHVRFATDILQVYLPWDTEHIYLPTWNNEKNTAHVRFATDILQVYLPWDTEHIYLHTWNNEKILYM